MWGPCSTPTTRGEEDWAVELACVAWVERDARRLALPRPLRGAAQAPSRVVRVIAMHTQLADIDIDVVEDNAVGDCCCFGMMTTSPLSRLWTTRI